MGRKLGVVGKTYRPADDANYEEITKLIVLTRTDAQAERVRIPYITTDALPKDNTCLISISVSFAQYRRCNLGALTNEIPAKITE